jgi:hypothetical protein
VPAPLVVRHQGLRVPGARCRDRQALRRLRSGRSSRAARGARAGNPRMGVLPDIAARDRRRYRGAGCARRRSAAHGQPGGRGARIQRAQRSARLGLGSRSAGLEAQRGSRRALEPRHAQRMVLAFVGSGARSRLRAHRKSRSRLVRWNARRRRLLRQLDGGARRAHRQGGLALPGGSPRRLGFRQPR